MIASQSATGPVPQFIPSGMGGPAVKYCTAHQRSTGTLTASSIHAPMVKTFVRVRRSFSDTPAAGGAEEVLSGVPVNSASGTPKKPESAKRFAVLGSDEPVSLN